MVALGSGIGLQDRVLDFSLGTSSKSACQARTGLPSVLTLQCSTLSVLFLATPLHLWGALTQWISKIS